MAHIAAKLEDGESLDVDKVRIWDFYLLFPDKVYNIHLHHVFLFLPVLQYPSLDC